MKKFIPLVVGVLAGTLSTYPVELRFLPSIILWGLAGIITGLLLNKNDKILWPGILYGVSLSVVFLFGRFGGTRGQILSYSILVLGFSVLSAFSGLLAVFVGTKIRNYFFPNSALN